MVIFSSISPLENALNVSTLKQRVIANNIANVDTPNYKSKEVSFQAQLNQAINQRTTLNAYRTHEKHIAFTAKNATGLPNAKIFTRPNTLINHNGNNVDMDYEMAQLAKNQLWYSAVTDRVSGKFNSLKTVISDRG